MTDEPQEIDMGPAPQTTPSMPPDIALAIIMVMGEIKALGKEGKNTFQKYDYTSVDQFYELVGPLMAKAGIFCLPFESKLAVELRKSTDDRGQTKESSWLVASYEIFVYHKSGVSFGPVTRSIQVPASGAQAYASAISYVEKYFLRSLFKIPTGDSQDDVDAHPKQSLPSGGREPSRDVNEDLREAEEAKDAFIQRAKTEWERESKTVEAHKAWWERNKEKIGVVFDNNRSDPKFIIMQDAWREIGKSLAGGSDVQRRVNQMTGGSPEPKPEPKPEATKQEPEAPKDDVPEFKGPPRPALAQIRMSLREALAEAETEEASRDAYHRLVVPYEASLPEEDIAELVKILRARIATLKP